MRLATSGASLDALNDMCRQQKKRRPSRNTPVDDSDVRASLSEGKTVSSANATVTTCDDDGSCARKCQLETRYPDAQW